MENKEKQKMTTAQAILVAGFLIMVGILLKSNISSNSEPKTLSEQVGVNKEELLSCIKATDLEVLSKNIVESADKAMSALPQDQRGTPYSVIIGKNGIKQEIRGAKSYEDVKKLIDGVLAGQATAEYKGGIIAKEEGDHTLGNPDAEILVVEYSDFECPFCKTFHETMKKIVADYDGKVAWTFRNLPYHQNSFEKLIASNCVAQIKGNDAFWKYSDLLFGLLKTGQESISDQL